MIERRKNTTIDGDFNIPFSLMDRTTRQDRGVNWGLEQYNKPAESNRHIQNSTQQLIIEIKLENLQIFRCETTLSSLSLLLCQNSVDYVYKLLSWVYLYVPLIYLSILSSIPHCLDCYSFVVNLEVKKH